MKLEAAKGHWLKYAGMAKQCWGAVLADQNLRIHGERDFWMGQMQIETCALQATPILSMKPPSLKRQRPQAR